LAQRQRQYLQFWNAFLAGTEDMDLQYFAASHGLDRHCVRLLIRELAVAPPLEGDEPLHEDAT